MALIDVSLVKAGRIFCTCSHRDTVSVVRIWKASGRAFWGNAQKQVSGSAHSDIQKYFSEARGIFLRIQAKRPILHIIVVKIGRLLYFS